LSYTVFHSRKQKKSGPSGPPFAVLARNAVLTWSISGFKGIKIGLYLFVLAAILIGKPVPTFPEAL